MENINVKYAAAISIGFVVGLGVGYGIFNPPRPPASHSLSLRQASEFHDDLAEYCLSQGIAITYNGRLCGDGAGSRVLGADGVGSWTVSSENDSWITIYLSLRKAIAHHELLGTYSCGKGRVGTGVYLANESADPSVPKQAVAGFFHNSP